jgi:cytochrome b involved in lipid metabolism
MITLDEVKAHAAHGDCWIIVRGKVYDVSKFMEKHPGGADLLLDNSSGKDAT